MSSTVKKEHGKYVVIKVDDMREYLPSSVIDELTDILELIAEGRTCAGKQRYNNYVVCNQDEPYADDVWRLILQGERVKHDQDREGEG